MPILAEIWEGVTVDLRKCRNKEDDNLYASQNIFHRMEHVNTANYKYKYAGDNLQVWQVYEIRSEQAWTSDE
jgi:hypothetical protein